MQLQYNRCPNDPNLPVASHVGVTSDGKVVEVGLAEVTSALSLHSATCVVTLAVRNGVAPDFSTRTAMALASSMKEDPHGLCLLIKILMKASLILQGRKALTDGGGLLRVDLAGWDKVDPSKGCSPNMETGQVDE